MSTEYHIEKVADFLRVPEDRQAACLAEFAEFLGIARGIVELARDVTGVQDAATIRAFRWIDDGKHTRTVRIEVQEPKKGGA